MSAEKTVLETPARIEAVPAAVQIARRALIEEFEIQQPNKQDRIPAASINKKAPKRMAKTAAAKIASPGLAKFPKIEARKSVLTVTANKPKISAAKILASEPIIQSEHAPESLLEIKLPSTVHDLKHAPYEAKRSEALPFENLFTLETSADMSAQLAAETTTGNSGHFGAEDEMDFAADQIEFAPAVEFSNEEWVELAIRDILGSEDYSLDFSSASETLPETGTLALGLPILDTLPPVFDEQRGEPQRDEKETAGIREQLAEYLELSSSGEIETAVVLVKEIVMTVKQLGANQTDQLADAADNTTAKKITKELEDLCKQLFETLGLDLDEHKLNILLKSLQQGEFDYAGFSVVNSPLEEGTHEQKQGTNFIFSMLIQLIGSRPRRHNLLGKLALQLKLVFPDHLDPAVTSI